LLAAAHLDLVMRHLRSDAYSAEQVLLNKRQI